MILEGYCLKTKQKEPFAEVVIGQTSKGGYIARGITKDGHKMVALMSKANAEAAVAAGVKKEGW